jgi:UDP-glucose 6-dehydrogenase
LPKDTLAMRQFLVDKGFSPSLLEAIINVNEETKNDPHKNGVVFDPYFQQRRHESYDNLR